MRTLRELGGWGLLLVVQLTPLVVLGLVALYADEVRSVWVLFAALLMTLLWPRMLLSARRLREPAAEEIAEADGRRPVVVLHRFTRVATPLLSRALFVQPGLWRDLRDGRRERAMERTLSAVGPVVSLARPGPPPTHGPVRLEDDSTWTVELDRHLRRSAMAVVVLDGSEANAIEIERAAALLGLARTILVIPPELPASAYAQLRERLPLLPELDRRARAIRFGAEDRPFYMSSLLVAPNEQVPQPKPPTGTWLLPVLAIFAGLFSAVGTPLLLDGRVHGHRDAFVAGGFAAFIAAVLMAGLSRRAVRLVPANEAVMVTVAAFPWLLMELGGWLGSLGDSGDYRLRGLLEDGAIGAAYAAPLLAAAAVILAVSSLVRRAPGRRGAFATFGAAALLPFWPLALSLDAVHADVSELVVGLFAGALALGLTAWSASGEPARANAPLPIGAAVAGALSVAAWCVMISHHEWARLIAGDAPSAETLARAPALAELGVAWPWFALAGPAVVVLVAMQFTGRATRVGIASMAAFVPFILVCALASSSEARARTRAHGSYAFGGVDVLAPAEGVALAPGFELPAVSYSAETAYDPADLVLDRSGVIAGGERLATLEQLALYGDGAPPAVSGALYAVAAGRNPSDGVLRLATSRDMDVAHVLRMLRAARRAGFHEVLLMGRGSNGSASQVRFATTATPSTDYDVRLYVIVEADAAVVRDNTGMYARIPHIRGAVDESVLRRALQERRQSLPNEQDANLVIQTHPGGAEEAAYVGSILMETHGRIVLMEHARL